MDKKIRNFFRDRDHRKENVINEFIENFDLCFSKNQNMSFTYELSLRTILGLEVASYNCVDGSLKKKWLHPEIKEEKITKMITEVIDEIVRFEESIIEEFK